MFTFPIVGQKIQLPEIFFLLLAPFILRYYRALVHHIQFLGPAIFLLLLPSLVHLSSCFLYPTQAAFLELGGSVYLALLALIFSWWFTVEHRPIHNLATISSVAIFLSFAISILSEEEAQATLEILNEIANLDEELGVDLETPS